MMKEGKSLRRCVVLCKLLACPILWLLAKQERDGEFAIGRLVISPVQPCRHTDHGTATKLHFMCACVKRGQSVGTDVFSLKNVVNIEEYTRQFTDMLKVTGTKGFNSPLKINLENNR